jgi:cytidyltransferase-like protein
MNKIVVVSGGFDPLHSGHIDSFKEAAKLGDYLIVALNSDQWLINKKTKYLLPFEERKSIIENLSMVDEVISFDDDEHGSCINALEKIKKRFKNKEILFCNGGDRKKSNIPEMQVKGIKFKFGIGGDFKKNSSSSILKKWNFAREERIWGSFYNLFFDKKIKIKELIINPKKGMSFQRHFYRSELWFVSDGSCLVRHKKKGDKLETEFHLKKNDIFQVQKEDWHQIINLSHKVCKIIEIQYGEQLKESDIERESFYEGN